MFCDLFVILCSCKNNTCFIALTFKQFWIWVPKPSSNILRDVASSILSFYLEWYDDLFLVSYKMTNIASWPQFKNQDSKLLDHAYFTFILAKFFESGTPFDWIFISFLSWNISKNNNNRKNERKYCPTSTVHKKEEQQESHRPPSAHSQAETPVNTEGHGTPRRGDRHYNPYFCNSSDCHCRLRSGK